MLSTSDHKTKSGVEPMSTPNAMVVKSLLEQAIYFAQSARQQLDFDNDSINYAVNKRIDEACRLLEEAANRELRQPISR